MSRSKDFENALKFAARLHAKQTSKGSDTPYISHLLAVAAIALEHGATTNEAIAALLHDAVEDQGGQETLEEIRLRYGNRVARIVEACSDTDETPKPPWRERKEAYIARIETAPYSVRLVIAADKLHNARRLLASYRVHGNDLWAYFKGGHEGTLWYYREVKAKLVSAAEPDEDQLNALIAEIGGALTALDDAIAEQPPVDQPVELA